MSEFREVPGPLKGKGSPPSLPSSHTWAPEGDSQDAGVGGGRGGGGELWGPGRAAFSLGGEVLRGEGTETGHNSLYPQKSHPWPPFRGLMLQNCALCHESPPFHRKLKPREHQGPASCPRGCGDGMAVAGQRVLLSCTANITFSKKTFFLKPPAFCLPGPGE